MIPSTELNPTSELANVRGDANLGELTASVAKNRQETEAKFSAQLQEQYQKTQYHRAKLQNEIDTAQVTDLYNAYSNESTEAFNNYKKLERGDAVNNLALAKTKIEFSKIRDKYLSEAGNKNQKILLNNKIAVKLNSLEASATGHSVSEFRRYIAETGEQAITLNKQDAIDIRSDLSLDESFRKNYFKTYYAAGMAELERTSKASGIPIRSEAHKGKIAQYKNEVYDKIISTLINNNEFDEAHAVLKEAVSVNAFGSNQLKTVEKLVSQGQEKEQSVRVVDDILTKHLKDKDIMGDKKPPDLPSLEAMKKDAQGITSAKVKSMAVADLDKRYKQLKKASAETYIDFLSKTTSEILDRTDRTISDLTPVELSRLKDEDLAKLKKGHSRETDPETLLFLHKNPKENTKLNIKKYRLDLSDEDYTARVAFGKRVETGEISIQRAQVNEKTISRELNRRLGMQLTTKTLSRYMEEAQDRADYFLEVHKRYPSLDETKQFVSEMLANEVRERHLLGLYTSREIYSGVDSKQITYILYSGESNNFAKHNDRIRLKDIPQDTKTRIIRAFKKEGIYPTQQQIGDEYVRLMGGRGSES